MLISEANPVVFRLNGTHVDQIPEVFREYGIDNHGELETAVEAAVRLARAAP